MKDHEIAKLVNDLRDIAIQFHGAQQLRARIADRLLPVLAGYESNGAGNLTDVALWDAAVKTLGLIQYSQRNPPHIEISSPDDARDLLNAWLATSRDGADKP